MELAVTAVTAMLSNPGCWRKENSACLGILFHKRPSSPMVSIALFILCDISLQSEIQRIRWLFKSSESGVSGGRQNCTKVIHMLTQLARERLHCLVSKPWMETNEWQMTLIGCCFIQASCHSFIPLPGLNKSQRQIYPIPTSYQVSPTFQSLVKSAA